MCAGTLVHISRHLGKTSNNNNKRYQLYIVVCFAEFASIGFHFGFSVLWSFLYYSCLHPTLPLVFYSTSLLLLSYHTISILYLISLTIYIYFLLYACAHDTIFLMHVYDSDLSTHLCLSMHATWHTHHHLPESTDSSGSSCLGLRAWTKRDLPAEDQAYFCRADRPAVAPVPSLLFWLARGISSYLVSALLYCSYLYISVYFAFAPIGDVIFL